MRKRFKEAKSKKITQRGRGLVVGRLARMGGQPPSPDHNQEVGGSIPPGPTINYFGVSTNSSTSSSAIRWFERCVFVCSLNFSVILGVIYGVFGF